MMRLWITRDRGKMSVFVWEHAPIHDDEGAWKNHPKWNEHNSKRSGFSVLETHGAKIILGDQWRDDGEFCFQIDVASVTRVLGRPQVIAKKLRAMTNETCCGETLVEAADLIETLIQK